MNSPMQQIPLPDSFPARSYHASGVVWSSTTSALAVLFGGMTKFELTSSIAETTVVDLSE